MTKEDLEQIGKLIDQKLEPIKKDMATKQDVQRLEQNLDKQADAMANFFHETWAKMDATNERVTNIEDHLDIPHPTKN